MEAYHNVAASPEFREMVRQRERALHNEASALANARLEERREIFKNMYEMGFGVADIAKATKFSEKDVKDILADFLKLNRKAVQNMLTAEWDSEVEKRVLREDAFLEANIKVARRLKAKGMSVDEIIELTDLSVDEVLKA